MEVEDNRVVSAITNGEFNELAGSYLTDETEEKTIVVISSAVPDSGLNVREGPSTNYTSFDKVNANEEYDYLDEQNGWYQIEIEETTGWVSHLYSSTTTVEVESIKEEGEPVEDTSIEQIEREVDFGIHFSIIDDKFALTGSMEAMEEIIDRLEDDDFNGGNNNN